MSRSRVEYVAVLTHLRGSGPSLSRSRSAVHDVMDFLCNLLALQERRHIHYFSNLSYLCLTDKSSALPTVKFVRISTDDLSCRSIDFIMPLQSLLSSLPQSVPICTSDESLEDFFNLCVNFGSGGLDPTYDPGRSVDHVHRSKIYKRLSA